MVIERMIVDISNKLDKIVGNRRFVSDKCREIELVIGFDEVGNRFTHLLSEASIDFKTV